MAMSAWGQIPDDLDIAFPPMQTPDARETAEIIERRTNAILAVYQNDLADAATAMKELKRMEEDAGMFGSISDEAIQAGEGQTYTSSKLLQDPMAGLERRMGEDEWQDS